MRNYFNGIFRSSRRSNRKGRHVAGAHKRRGSYSRLLAAESLEERRMLSATIVRTAYDVYAEAQLTPPLFQAVDDDNDEPFALLDFGPATSGSSTNHLTAFAGVTPYGPGIAPTGPPPFLNGSGAMTEVGAEHYATFDYFGSGGGAGWGIVKGIGNYQVDITEGNPTRFMEVRAEILHTWTWDISPDFETEDAYIGAYSGIRAEVKFEQVRGTSLVNEFDVMVSGWGTTRSGPEYVYTTTGDITGYVDYDGTPELDHTHTFLLRHKFWVLVQDGDFLNFYSHGDQDSLLLENSDGSPRDVNGALYYGAGGIIGYPGQDGSVLTTWFGSAGITGHILPDSITTPPQPVPGDVTAPRVSNVILSGTNSPDAPYSYSTNVYGQQRNPAQVRNADTITVNFIEQSGQVYLTEDDLQVVGIHSGDKPVVESFTLSGNSATWVFAEPFKADEYKLTLDDYVTDSSGNWLDGEWTDSAQAFPSGDGTPGGDFVFTFNPSPLGVTTLVDELDTDYTYGDLSLREAMALATTFSGADTITFAEDLAGTIELNSPLVHAIGTNPNGNDITIDGPGADQIAIDANNATNVFSFTSGAYTHDITIEGLKLTGAANSAITKTWGVTVNLTLDQVEIVGNGGGLSFSYGGVLTITNSTIAENNGVGVQLAFMSPSKIVNSTISSNQSSGIGGLVVSFGSVTLVNVTVFNNRGDKNNSTGGSTFSAGLQAGGGGTITLQNTIVAGNFAGADGPNDVERDLGRDTGVYYGTFQSSSAYNLIGCNSLAV